MPSPGGSCTGNIWTCGRCLVGERCYEAAPVTRETLLAALTSAKEALDAQALNPQPHQHVVSPKAAARGGWTRCADCFGAVYLPTPEATDA